MLVTGVDWLRSNDLCGVCVDRSWTINFAIVSSLACVTSADACKVGFGVNRSWLTLLG